MTLIVWLFRLLKVRDAFRRLRLLKYWGAKYGVWLGVGWQSERTRAITRTWLRTVFPPYLHGVGVSLCKGMFSVRIGVYKRVGDFEMYGEDEDIEGELAAIGWGLGAESDEVGSWENGLWVPWGAGQAEASGPTGRPDGRFTATASHDGVLESSSAAS